MSPNEWLAILMVFAAWSNAFATSPPMSASACIVSDRIDTLLSFSKLDKAIAASLFAVSESAVIAATRTRWPAVNSCHPTLGTPCGMGDIEIHNYEVVVEADIEIAPGEEVFVKSSTILPPGETSYVVPDDFIALSDEWKFEILAHEESFNQTAIESCFVIE